VTRRAFRGVRGPPRARALLLACALLGTVHAGGPRVAAALRYERTALADGEWWRALAAHLVHFDLAHLALNVAGLVLLWWLFVADARAREWLVVVGVAAVTVTLGLWYGRPELAWYVGASGVLHGVWAAGGVFSSRRWPLESGVTLALLVAKLVWERYAGPLGATAGGLPVIVDAHLYGALGGLAAALALRLGGQRL